MLLGPHAAKSDSAGARGIDVTASQSLPTASEQAEVRAFVRRALSGQRDNNLLRLVGLRAALLDARPAVGRAIRTGETYRADRSASWLGTIGYLVLLDHIGAWARPPGSTEAVTDEPFVDALTAWTSLDAAQTDGLWALRCALLGGYGLQHVDPMPSRTHHFLLEPTRGDPITVPSSPWKPGVPRTEENATHIRLAGLHDTIEQVVDDVIRHVEDDDLTCILVPSAFAQRFGINYPVPNELDPDEHRAIRVESSHVRSGPRAQDGHLLYWPHLPLRTDLAIGRRWLIRAVDTWHLPEEMEAVGLGRLLRKHRTGTGAQVRRMAVLTDGDNWFHDRPARALKDKALQRALLMATLWMNPQRDEERDQAVPTADCLDLFGWAPRADDRYFATQAGLLVSTLQGGLRLDNPEAVIAAPVELPQLLEIRPDADLANAAYRVLRRATNAAAPRPESIGFAIDWLGRAWRNTTSIGAMERIVLVKTGFEALTGESTAVRGAQALRRLWEATLHIDRHVAEDHLYWTCRERPIVMALGSKPQPPITRLEHWFESFSAARNQVIHDGHLTITSYRNAKRYSGPFFWVGEAVLRQSIVVAIGLHDGFPWWRRGLGRAAWHMAEALSALHNQCPEPT